MFCSLRKGDYPQNSHVVLVLAVCVFVSTGLPQEGTNSCHPPHRLNEPDSMQCKITLICFHIVSGTAPPYLSELLHLYSPSRCLRSAAILASSVFLGWADGHWRRDPFNTLDLCSGTPFLSLSGIRLHSLLLSQNRKPICSVIYTDLSFYQSITSNACICSVCVCGVCV